MTDFDFRSLNLNLLPALDALLTERNVSAAARRMGVSQSAMSHSLAKLREVFDDPLLVPVARRLVRTPRAEKLVGPLRQALDGLGTALRQGEPFDPKTARRSFTIATFDLFEILTAPELLAYLQTHAPGVSLRIERLTSGSVDAAARGEVDLIFAGKHVQMPAGLNGRDLFCDRYAVIARDGHPSIPRGGLTLARYLALDHVLVSVEGQSQGVVDRALHAEGRSRRVALRVPHFMSAVLVVARSDCISTLPSSLAAHARQAFGVRVLPAPIELPPSVVSAWWPRRLDADPGHTWFRELFLSGRALSRSLRRMIRE